MTRAKPTAFAFAVLLAALCWASADARAAVPDSPGFTEHQMRNVKGSARGIHIWGRQAPLQPGQISGTVQVWQPNRGANGPAGGVLVTFCGPTTDKPARKGYFGVCKFNGQPKSDGTRTMTAESHSSLQLGPLTIKSYREQATLQLAADAGGAPKSGRYTVTVQAKRNPIMRVLTGQKWTEPKTVTDLQFDL